jgi:N4-(beta-N-acetylglucosaminyl)-L-asparaginase
VAQSTRDRRLLDAGGRPRFQLKFYALDKRGRYGAASLWSGVEKRARFAVCDARGARLEDCAFLYKGKPARS